MTAVSIADGGEIEFIEEMRKRVLAEKRLSKKMLIGS